MATYHLEMHRAATAEAREAREYYELRNPKPADGFIAELDAAIAAILEAPDRWPKQGRGTRRYRLDDFPYSVVYRIIGDAVRVIAVAHGKRRPGYWRSR